MDMRVFVHTSHRRLRYDSHSRYPGHNDVTDLTFAPQVRSMLDALKSSNEPEHLVQAATRYLKGLKGNLVQLKKQKAAKEHATKEEAAAAAFQQYHQQQSYSGQQQMYGGQQQSYGQPQLYGQPAYRQQSGPPPTGPGYYTTHGWMG